jgi:hypothetical protein
LRPEDFGQAPRTGVLEIDVGALSQFCASDHLIGYLFANFGCVLIRWNFLTDKIKSGRHVRKRALIKLDQHYRPRPAESFSNNAGSLRQARYCASTLELIRRAWAARDFLNVGLRAAGCYRRVLGRLIQ